METIKVLEQLGLEGKQALVYAALLELGTASVMSIAKKAGLKRPTSYLILDELESKGLVSQVPQVRKTLFVAEAPEKLQTELRKKQELLALAMPQLEAVYNARKDKPKVQMFSGSVGVQQVYDLIFKSGAVWFFGTIREVSKLNPGGLKEFLKKTKESKVEVREILSDTKEDREYASLWRGNSNSHLIRFLPKEIKYSVSDSAIFGDNIVFFSFHPQIFGVMISSREVSGTAKAMFELAWQSAREA